MFLILFGIVQAFARCPDCEVKTDLEDETVNLLQHRLTLNTTGVNESAYQCLDTYTYLSTTLSVGVDEGQDKYKAFQVPPMSPDPDVYAYAFEQAFIVLPARCVVELGLQPNVGDGDKFINVWMGRKGDLSEASLNQTLDSRDAVLGSCACGWAIFLHGSGGFTYDNPRYSIMMAAAGYGVLAPDSFAGRELGLRYKAPIHGLASHLHKMNSNTSTLTYWCSDYVYEPDAACTPSMLVQSMSEPSYPLCYDSDAMNILSHTTDWRHYYERVFQLRKLELDYLVDRLPHYVQFASKVFLVGDSEGAMVAARYYNPKLEGLLESGGRVILSWSCEFCYYVSCPENARIGSGKANITTPLLSMISHMDPFFGPQGPPHASIAWEVANGPGGYGATGAQETGNCFAQFQSQGFKHAYVFKDVTSQYHGLGITSGNLVRAALHSFLANPRSPTSLARLSSGPDGAQFCDFEHVRQHGLLYGTCTELGLEQLVPGSLMPKCAYIPYEYHMQFDLFGDIEACASRSRVARAARTCVFTIVAWLMQ